MIKLGLDAVVVLCGNELMSLLVDPGPHAYAEIVHLHGTLRFSGLDEPGRGICLDDWALELVRECGLRWP